jgi:hypothetical protein
LEPLEMTMANRVVDGSIIFMLNIWKDFIPCTWMVGVVHSQYVHNHPIDHFCLSICLGVEGS